MHVCILLINARLKSIKHGTKTVEDITDGIDDFEKALASWQITVDSVSCSSAMFSSLIEVIAFINETQVFMYDNSNFIYESSIYLQVYTFKEC